MRKSRIDPLVAEVAAVLSPVAATAPDKARQLVARLDPSIAGWRPRGLGDAIRKLRATLPDEDILAAAHNLLLELMGKAKSRGLPEP